MSDPKIEPWMTAAAEEIVRDDGSGMSPCYMLIAEKQHPEWTFEQIREDTVRRIAERYAPIIARHAPDPASVPIGPGDAVQVVSETHARSWLGIVREQYDNGKWFVVGYGCADTHELARIGRAVYWPDRTKVEEGGE